jgi:DNA-binding transcriptional MerR regulator
LPERTHLSIGEVLSLLREEFPDVTISKIRFLESQGLVDPERTPSGYRKFYDHDVDRLRHILRLQREQFLPLKIIRGRLTEEGEAGQQPSTTAEHPALTPSVPNVSRAPSTGGPGPAEAADPSAPDRLFSPPGGGVAEASTPPLEAVSDPKDETASGRAGQGATSAPPSGPEPGTAQTAGRSAGNGIRSRAAANDGQPVGHGDHNHGDGVGGDSGPRPTVDRGIQRRPPPGEEDSLTQAELANASGLTESAIDELVQFGLLAGTSSAGFVYFPRDELEVAKAAAGFAGHGIEARHLRVWRTAADRESSLFQQVVTPLVRQRNPQARDEALATLDELAGQARALHDALLRRALRELR